MKRLYAIFTNPDSNKHNIHFEDSYFYVMVQNLNPEGVKENFLNKLDSSVYNITYPLEQNCMVICRSFKMYKPLNSNIEIAGRECGIHIMKQHGNDHSVTFLTTHKVHGSNVITLTKKITDKFYMENIKDFDVMRIFLEPGRVNKIMSKVMINKL